ncbi:MAG: transglycosylase domain-containing protein [Clostridia bacterium]
MKNKFGKILLWSATIIFFASIVFVLAGAISYFTGERTKFEIEKITHQNISIDFFDNKDNIIRQTNRFCSNYVKLGALPAHVPASFVSIEDKDFYKHKGINVKRMISASFTNIKNRRIVQGASTISQQLIKNTHLTTQKTFRRKVNEIELAISLEKQLTKNQILEKYLNLIYFGDGCYGIENASQHFFNKSAKYLTISEGALLAGIIKSPANFSPYRHMEASKTRRNIVLQEMLNDKKISQKEFDQESCLPIILTPQNNKNSTLNCYLECALDQATKILNTTAKQLAIGDYRIYTNFNKDKQDLLEKSFNYHDPNCDYSAISINSKTGVVEGYVAKGNLKVSECPRQPGSAIKPLLVYAPAIEEGIISPITQVLDEKIYISNYSPNNVSGNFEGYVSVEKAVAKSLNVPAVKIMGYLGIPKSKIYGEKLGIKFNKNDTGYALALGGMTEGTTIGSLTGAYTPFANQTGYYTKPSFLKYIANSNGEIIWKNNDTKTKVFENDTTYLTTNMLCSAVKNGISKSLFSKKYQVAAKSGTVGKTYEKNNKDAWSVAYTTADLVGVWLGNLDGKNIEYNGGNMPSKISKTYFDSLYLNESPVNFTMPNSVVPVEIDSLELEQNHKVCKANEFTPEKYRQTALFSKRFLPHSTSSNFIWLSAPTLDGHVENDNAVLTFNTESHLEYEIYKIENNQTTLLKQIRSLDGKQTIFTPLKQNVRTKFYVISIATNYATKQQIKSEISNKIELVRFNNYTSFSTDKNERRKLWI